MRLHPCILIFDDRGQCGISGSSAEHRNTTHLLTPMSSTISPRLVFLSFSFSIASGLCFLNSGHSLLQSLGVPGFTTLPPYTSLRIGLAGGAFTALPVLALRAIPSELSDSFDCSYVVIFLLAIIAIGAAQGYVGARMWKGRIYTIIGGEKLPGVLGVGSASLAGAVGALVLVGATICFLTVGALLLDHFFPKERLPPGRTRPIHPEQPGPVEAERNQL